MNIPRKIPSDTPASRDAGSGSADILPAASKDAGAPGASKGWYSRGYLPHLDQPGLYQSITFRLEDSVPEAVIQRWQAELRWRADLPSDAPAVVKLRRQIVAYEDAGHGACWLRLPVLATLVEEALFHFDGQRYRLIAWCIMPNHVHVLIETWAGYPLDKVLHSWRSYTAQQANQVLKRRGAFWARDYYDRYMRDEAHFRQTVTYIEENPVKAKLVKAAADWRFSSAARK